MKMVVRWLMVMVACGAMAACVESRVTEREADGTVAVVKREVKGAAVVMAKKRALPPSTGMDQDFRVDVGGALEGTNAELAVWVKEPPKGVGVKGTVIFLHGFMATHSMLEGAAGALSKQGYRTVLVDLRGFGESGGEHITFGVMDAQDLKQLTDALVKKGLCGEAVGVFGTSYGAASAIQYAAIDPRVKAVVAVAPFASIREEVPAYARHMLRGMAAMLTDADLNAMADTVARMANLDLDSAKPLDAITKTSASVLLIHGDKDSIIPHTASERLHAADPEKSELMTVEGKGHLELCFDPMGRLYGTTRAFFDKNLGE